MGGKIPGELFRSQNVWLSPKLSVTAPSIINTFFARSSRLKWNPVHDWKCFYFFITPREWVFQVIPYFYRTCNSLLFLCNGWRKVRTHWLSFNRGHYISGVHYQFNVLREYLSSKGYYVVYRNDRDQIISKNDLTLICFKIENLRALSFVQKLKQVSFFWTIDIGAALTLGLVGLPFIGCRQLMISFHICSIKHGSYFSLLRAKLKSST